MENNVVFSDYEVRELGFKFGETVYTVPCVGSLEEELDVLVITKNCRGVPAKVRARGKGTGKLNLSAHMPYNLIGELYAMIEEGLAEGVRAYGQASLHKEFTLTVDCYDEDGNEKLKAYPRCLIQSNLSRKTENGAEEVAEMELEISIMPDADNMGMYEAIVADLTDETIKTKWMAEFTTDMVKVTTA